MHHFIMFMDNNPSNLNAQINAFLAQKERKVIHLTQTQDARENYGDYICVSIIYMEVG